MKKRSTQYFCLLLAVTWIFPSCGIQNKNRSSELANSNKNLYELANVAKVLFADNDNGNLGTMWNSFVQVSAVLSNKDDQCTFVKPGKNDSTPWDYVQVVWIHKDQGGDISSIADTFYPGYHYGKDEIKNDGGNGIRYLNSKEKIMAKVVSPNLNKTGDQLKLNFQIKGKEPIPLTITAFKADNKCRLKTAAVYKNQHVDPLESITIGVLPHSSLYEQAIALRSKNILVEVNDTN